MCSANQCFKKGRFLFSKYISCNLSNCKKCSISCFCNLWKLRGRLHTFEPCSSWGSVHWEKRCTRLHRTNTPDFPSKKSCFVQAKHRCGLFGHAACYQLPWMLPLQKVDQMHHRLKLTRLSPLLLSVSDATSQSHLEQNLKSKLLTFAWGHITDEPIGLHIISNISRSSWVHSWTAKLAAVRPIVDSRTRTKIHWFCHFNNYNE
jgi:hypothetical protein